MEVLMRLNVLCTALMEYISLFNQKKNIPVPMSRENFFQQMFHNVYLQRMRKLLSNLILTLHLIKPRDCHFPPQNGPS